MSVEKPNQQAGAIPAAAGSERRPAPAWTGVAQAILAVLEQHDGLCLDEPGERAVLAGTLATALADHLIAGALAAEESRELPEG